MEKDFLKIAGNIHLSYYVRAADELGIDYEIIIYRMTAKFSTPTSHWFINTTAVPINNAPSSRLARAKHLANKVLSLANIPVPKQIKAQTVNEAIDFFNQYKDIVLKPSQNLGGHGISILPTSEQEVRDAYKEAKENDRSGRVLVEEYIHGDNYRFLVVGDKVVSVVRRLPAHVTGDGVNTIKDLVVLENIKRKSNFMMHIPYDEETIRHIISQGYSEETVLENGKTINVRKNTNLTTGGTTEECLSEVHQSYIDIAIKATKALDLRLGGVDLIIKDITTPGECAINEVNYNPGLRLHYKVDKGQPVHVAYHIMKYIKEYYEKLN